VLVGVMVVVLSYLMVSRVRFRSMKDLRLTKRTLAVVALLIMTAIVVAVRISQPAVLIFLVELRTSRSAWSRSSCWSARAGARLAARSAAEPAAPQSPVVESADDEREVLAELGVDDEPARPEA
jgi:CDP-diacylglycerol--serine O-phosphatidyltransferase